jgi:hypothetical protein
LCFEEFEITLKNKKGHPFGWPFIFSKDLRSSRGFGLCGFFRFRRHPFAFEVALPAFPIFNFIGLFAHKYLYIGRVFRFCGVHYETLDTTIQHLFDAGGGAGAILQLPKQKDRLAGQRAARSHRNQS